MTHTNYFSSRSIALAFLFFALATVVRAQEPLQFNVPYRCPDGTSNIITRCEKNARAEVCFWREEKDGQLITERYNVRGQMDGWLQTCKVQAPPPAAPVPNQPASQGQTQALNPPYLVGFPDVDKVKRAIQGSNPVDTLARQVAVLNYLPRIIQRMQMVPGRPYNSTTPDEQKIMNAYAAAAYELSQSYLKSASPANTTAFQQMTGRYEMNSALSQQMFALLSPATLVEFGKIDAAASAQAKARIDQQLREAEQARTQPPARAAGTASAGNDPGMLAARRCLELGGGELECAGKGLTTGMADLAGVGDLLALTSIVPTGVRMGGTYKTEAGISIQFDAQRAGITGCGKLEPESGDYSVTKKGDQLQVELQTKPKPLVMMLLPDGRFTGPAAFDITGQVIVGYNKYWVEERRASDNSVVVGTGHEVRVPIYEPKTERCAFATLRASAPVQAEGSLIGGLVGIVNGQADPASQRSGTTEAPAGARMSGTYTGAGGLKLEFRPTAVVLDCGEAHVLRPYSVQNLVDRFVVTVRNDNVPLPLTLRLDGVLVGSGNAEVAGRVVAGTNASGVTFAPRTATCPVGSLSPQ